jgi:hypothetical protein
MVAGFIGCGIEDHQEGRAASQFGFPANLVFPFGLSKWPKWVFWSHDRDGDRAGQ